MVSKDNIDTDTHTVMNTRLLCAASPFLETLLIDDALPSSLSKLVSATVTLDNQALHWPSSPATVSSAQAVVALQFFSSTRCLLPNDAREVDRSQLHLVNLLFCIPFCLEGLARIFDQI